MDNDMYRDTHPDDAARIYIRPDYTSGAPLWPQCRYPRRHRLNLFGVEGRNFGRLVRATENAMRGK